MQGSCRLDLAVDHLRVHSTSWDLRVGLEEVRVDEVHQQSSCLLGARLVHLDHRRGVGLHPAACLVVAAAAGWVVVVVLDPAGLEFRQAVDLPSLAGWVESGVRGIGDLRSPSRPGKETRQKMLHL